MKPVKIPQRIDEPPHILMWSADELAPMLLGMVVGVMIGKAFICIAVGYLITNVYKKYRDNHPDGYLLHILYWWGLMGKKNSHSFKNPYARDYLP